MARKSTSEDVPRTGTPCFKAWSATQPRVALSTGDAELYGVARNARVGPETVSMLSYFGAQAPAVMRADSLAAKGPVLAKNIEALNM